MRRFFLQSLFLHGLALALLFSGESPSPGKYSSRDILRVELVEKEERAAAAEETKREKPGEEKQNPTIAPPPLPIPKEKKRALRKPAAAPEILRKQEKPPEILSEARTKKEEVPPASLPPEAPSFPHGPLPDAPLEAGLPKPQRPAAEEDFSPARISSAAEVKPAVPPPPGSGAADSISEPGAEQNSAGMHTQSRFREGAGNFAYLPREISEAEAGPPAGNSTGETSALRGGAPAPALSDADPVLLMIIRRIEEAKRYPRAARRMGIEGTTVVRFKLEPGGQVEKAEVAESSGFDILDKASLETVRQAAPLPYKEGWLKVGIVFKIL